MALPDAQNLPISFINGVDTKDDPKQLLPGKMLSLQNASFQNPKEIRKRDGYTSITSSINGGGTVSAGVTISNYQNELVSLDGSSVYSYSPDLTKQINKGSLVPINLSVSPVVRNTEQQTSPDSAYHSGTGLRIFTWIDTGSGGINYSIFDTTTGVSIVSNSTVISTGTKAKTILLGSKFIILYYDSSGTSLKYKYVDTATPTSLSSATTIANDINTTNQAFDATLINSILYIAYGDSSGNKIGFYSLTSGLSLSSQYLVTTNHTARCITVVGDASFNAWAFYGSIEAGNKYATWGLIVNAALNSTVLANTQLYILPSGTGLTVNNITAKVSGTTGTAYWESSTSLAYNTLTLAGTAGTTTIYLYAIGLVSKMFTVGSNDYFLAVYNGNTAVLGSPATEVSIEPTYFLMNVNGNVVLKIAPGVAGGFSTSRLLPEITTISSTDYIIPYLIQDNLTSLGGNVFYKTGVMSAEITFTTSAIPKLNMGNVLHLGAGQLWMYDGANIVEHGFHLFPEFLGLQSLLSSGGGIGSAVNFSSTLNQVQYKAVYEWSDNQGNIHRSAPSPALTVPLFSNSGLSVLGFTADSTINSKTLVNVSSTGAVFVGQVFVDATSASNIPAGTYITAKTANTVTLSQYATATRVGDTYQSYDITAAVINIPTLQITLKNLVSIVLYRTQNNASIFYRVSSVSSFTYNDKTVSYVAITDTTPDNAIVGNEQLYTTGGEVANIAAPAVSALVPFKNRALYISPENPFQWGYSKQLIQGSPVEFNSQEFVENVDQRIGRLSAFSPMDDKIILFGPNTKFYVVGSGPGLNGSNNDFTDAIIIAGTTGCTNQYSVLEIPIGVIYQDPNKGIWLLDRSLQEEYIGADVESFNASTITSAQKVPNSNKVMFTLSTGSNLIYDYYVKQWEVDVYPAAVVDSTLFQNDVVYIQSNGAIRQQTPGVYTDNGTVIPIYFKTGWLNLASVSGYQRVWELQLLGTYVSPHTLTINIYSDYSSTISQTVSIPVLSDPGLYQFRIKITNQKCEAIQIELTESQSGSGTEGFRLSSMEFRAGVKRGLDKLPAAATYG